MVKAVEDGLVSNPFLEIDPKEFVSIITGEIYDPEIYNSMKEIKLKGDAQAEEYVDKVIEKGKIPVTNTIPRNNFYTLQNRPPAVLDKERKPGCKNPTAIVTRYFMYIKNRLESEQEDFLTV